MDSLWWLKIVFASLKARIVWCIKKMSDSGQFVCNDSTGTQSVRGRACAVVRTVFSHHFFFLLVWCNDNHSYHEIMAVAYQPGASALIKTKQPGFWNSVHLRLPCFFSYIQTGWSVGLNKNKRTWNKNWFLHSSRMHRNDRSKENESFVHSCIRGCELWTATADVVTGG
jgi:hypothetical protein